MSHPTRPCNLIQMSIYCCKFITRPDPPCFFHFEFLQYCNHHRRVWFYLVMCPMKTSGTSSSASTTTRLFYGILNDSAFSKASNHMECSCIFHINYIFWISFNFWDSFSRKLSQMQAPFRTPAFWKIFWFVLIFSLQTQTFQPPL